MGSDGHTPAKQAEQILAIYPILQGQSTHHPVIPPQHTRHNTAENPGKDNGGDLIDFGQNEEPSPAKPEPPTKIEKHPSSEITNLLESTGQKANGPLIDFTGDLKKDLPSEEAKIPNRIKRADTEDSNDAFFDAET